MDFFLVICIWSNSKTLSNRVIWVGKLIDERMGRKVLTLHVDPLSCEHPLKSSVPFWSIPFLWERGLS